MKDKHLFHYYWSKDINDRCVVCKESLQKPFRIYLKRTVTEFWSAPSWWAGVSTKQQKIEWKLDFTTAVCEECLFGDRMETLIRKSKHG